MLRAALYGHAFNPARASTDPGPPATTALTWASHHCLPLTALADPQVTRRALDALALRLDGTGAAATTITRKRAVFHGCLGYAAELGLLAANPLDRTTRRPPRPSCPPGPRSAATPAQVQAILAEVTQIRPEGAIRTVPIPPQLARLLYWHLRAFGCAADGRLFQGARGGPLSESLYGRIWHQARAAAMPQNRADTHPARRPYDLRHAALSLWLSSGAPPAEVAARAGHSVHVLLTTYAHCIPGWDQIASQHIEQALRPSRWLPAGPQKSAQTPRIPSVMRPCHGWDSTGHSWT